MHARAAADPDSTVLWLPHPPGRSQSGRHVIFYAVGAFFWFLVVLMLWFFFGGFAVAGLVPGTLPSLGAAWNPFGIVFVVFASLGMTFILIMSVFLLTQGVILAILSRRSIRAPKDAALAYIFVFALGGRAGAVVTPTVHTPVTRFWTDIGNAVVTRRLRILVPAFLIGLADVLLNASPDWRHDGVDMPVLYGIIIGLVVIGIPGAIWGVTRRVAQLRTPEERARDEDTEDLMDSLS